MQCALFTKIGYLQYRINMHSKRHGRLRGGCCDLKTGRLCARLFLGKIKNEFVQGGYLDI